MKIIILIFITQVAFASNSLEVSEAKKSLTALLAPFLNKTPATGKMAQKDFQIQGCKEHRINWLNVAMMKEEALLKYRFGPGCDVEGDFAPRIFQVFPVELKLRNLDSYHRLNAQNKITATLESRPVLKIEVTSGVLTGSGGQVKFDADYQVQLDPMKKGNQIDKNLGGEIRINEIFGKKVFIKEKILVE